MPIYEYQCKACGKVTDFLQKMSDEPMVTCPECKEDALKKLISAPRFRLAGSGWYETDFKEGDNKRNLVSSDSESKSSKSKADAKSDTKKDSTSKKTETKSKSAESKIEAKSSTKKDGGKAA